MSEGGEASRPPPPLHAKLRVLRGQHGTEKVFCLPAPQQAAGAAVLVLFVGDQLEARHVPPEVRELQEPRRQAALMAAKFPGTSVAVVMPSRLEGCFACFDHFLGRTTASGEPLGYGGAELKAAGQIATLLQDGGLWEPWPAAPPPPQPPGTGTNAEGEVPPPPSARSAAAAPGPAAVQAPWEAAGADPCGAAGSGGVRQKPPPTAHPLPDACTPHAMGPTAAGEGLPEHSAHPRPRPVILAGFSKGGVVLNQFLAELAAWGDGAAGPAATAASAAPGRPAAGAAATASAATRSTGAMTGASGSIKGGGGGSSAGGGTWERAQLATHRQAACMGASAVPPNGGVGRGGAMQRNGAPGQAAGAAPCPPAAAAALLEAVAQVHYLDVGLNCRGAFMTDPNVANSLQRIASRRGSGAAGAAGAHLPHVFLHGTPRQWDDPTRPWVGREAEVSARLLRGAGLPLAVRKYFRDQKPSLAMHFRVLQDFCPQA